MFNRWPFICLYLRLLTFHLGDPERTHTQKMKRGKSYRLIFPATRTQKHTRGIADGWRWRWVEAKNIVKLRALSTDRRVFSLSLIRTTYLSQ